MGRFIVVGVGPAHAGNICHAQPLLTRLNRLHAVICDAAWVVVFFATIT